MVIPTQMTLSLPNPNYADLTLARRPVASVDVRTPLYRMGRGSAWHHPAIQMPGCVPEHREDDDEADEEGDRPDHQADCDDQAPDRHRARVREYRADRCQQCRGHVDISVEQQG